MPSSESLSGFERSIRYRGWRRLDRLPQQEEEWTEEQNLHDEGEIRGGRQPGI